MKEKFPTTETPEAKPFKPEDLERLEEIKKIREEILSSKSIPEAVKKTLAGLDVEPKQKDVEVFLESRGKEKESIAVEGKEVRIGEEKTPIWEGTEEKLSWDLTGKQFREDGQTMVEIAFHRNDGLEVEPGGPIKGKVRFEERDRFMPLSEYKAVKKEYSEYLAALGGLNSADSKKRESSEKYLKELKKKHPESEWALRALRYLNGMAVERAKEIVECDPYFVEPPYVIETMEKFTKLINRQRERGQGVLILEGDAGTGKNKIVDHFAYLTHRPLFRFTCSAGKDEQDLKYLLEYDSKKGTYRIKSTVVEALETQGAILEFDEINTLKPEIAKMLNSLFDHDRAIFLGEDRQKVEAQKEVILVGLQNPQHYMGVKPLPETIKSRARMMEIAYPPFEKEKTGPNEKTKYRSDEAMILRKHIPELNELDEKEFQLIWDSVVNGKSDRRAVDLLTADRKERIEDVKEIVEIANKVRQSYRAYHEGKSDEAIKFVFSLRESVEAAYELPEVELTAEEKKKGMTRAKKAVQEVILPKIPIGEERTYLTTLIAEL